MDTQTEGEYAPESGPGLIPPAKAPPYAYRVGGNDQTSRVSWDGHVLTVIRQRTRAAQGASSEDWMFTDTAGHMHVFGSEQDPYPTLTRVTDGWAGPPDFDEDDDANSEFEHYHLACRECGQTVWPAEGGPETEYLPGVFVYLIDGDPVAKVAARQFMDQIRVGNPGKWERLYGWMEYSAKLLPPVRRKQPATSD
jgi:hypothetical protein